MKVDRAQPIVVGTPVFGAGEFGFRGGFTGATIDDLVVVAANGSVFRDSFRNEEGWLKITALHSILLAAIFGLVIFLLLKVARWQEAVVMNGSLIAAAQFFVCLSLFHTFDFFYWSKIPFQTEMRQEATGKPVPQMSFELYRYLLFKKWRGYLGRERNLYDAVAAEYPLERVFRGPIFCGKTGEECIPTSAYPTGPQARHCVRFLLVGSSQSIGSGASSLEQSFFVRLHRSLSKAITDRCVESLNLAISGSKLDELTSMLEKHLAFRPDIVVLNFSSNGSTHGFYEGLQRFAEINRKINSKLIFVEEANSSDQGDRPDLKEKHKIMRRAGRDSGIETFSMQNFLGNEGVLQSGQVWWDFVHLSSYGQALVADWMLPKVLAGLRNGDGSKRGPRRLSSEQL